MDALSDDELADIWARTKTQIDTSKIKSISRDGVIAELGSVIRKAAEKNPSLQGLVRGNFAGNAVDVVRDDLGIPTKLAKPKIARRVVPSRIKAALKGLFSPKEIREIALRKIKARVSVALVAQRVEGVQYNVKTNKVKIETRKGKRSYSLKNLRATISVSREKPVAYFYNTRLKRMISRKSLIS